VAALDELLDIRAVSGLWESDPVGYTEQPRFLNAVVVGRWRGTPGELLEAVHALEDRAGRLRPFPDAPRTLDVDILLFRRGTVQAPELTVPHPRWKGRAFVLAPLAEVVGEWRDPESGRTVEEVWSDRRSELPPVWRVAHAASSAPESSGVGDRPEPW
jgi:2-amino-4-hydroxy-6-hydroxymethyldihydropteridine diphosphokinase